MISCKRFERGLERGALSYLVRGTLGRPLELHPPDLRLEELVPVEPELGLGTVEPGLGKVRFLLEED